MARPVNGVDELSIVIEADASRATAELNRLSQSITTLSNALRGANLQPFTASLKDLKNTASGLNLTPINTQVNKISNTMNKYAQNTVKMSTANKTGASSFTLLSRGFGSVFSGLTSINNKVDSFASKMRKANKDTKNFAQTVGLLYARFFLLIRGTKLLVNAVKSSMNYIEVLNYFDASFGQVAERGVEKWSQMGYDSAEAYYNSFSERAKKVTADMSGFFPEENGALTKTGMASLGMNPQQLMQYQAQFAQMSSSMGTTSEQALLLSEVLTKLGADLASVKNMEFQDVWKDMASGLVGMSRTLDKYGANIRNANMEMKLHELGINATVSKLSQADKALLRTIILLDSSKYAWADLAETLNTPANQFRMLANNIKLLGQMIGNIFLPIVAKVLPYINAFVIALQRLFTWLAKILGIDLSGLLGKNTGFDNSGISDLLDDAENVGQALDDDADSAKKLKRQLQGFDALNNLTTKEDTSKGADSALASGLLNDAFIDAVNDYLKAWQDAFDKIQNKAEKIADKIEKFFKRLTKPIFEAWKKVGDKVVQQWKNAGYNLKLLFRQIGKDFWRVWEQPETQTIFENIFTVFGNIGEVVQHLANRFREAWVANDNGFRILQAIRDIILIISDKAKEMSESFVEWSKDLNLKPLMAKMAEFMESMKPVIQSLMEVLKDFLDDVLLPLAKWTLEEGLPKLLQVFIDFKNKVNWEKLKKNLKTLWEHLEPFAEKVGEGFILFLERASKALAEFVNSKKFEDFLKKLEDWMDNLTKEDIADFFETLAKALVTLKVALMAWKVLSPIIKIIVGIGYALVGLGKGLGAIWKVGKWFASGGLTKAFATFGMKVGKICGEAGASIGKLVGSIVSIPSEISKTMMSLGGSGAGGLAGIWEFLNMDFGALVSSGSVATAGMAIGTALIGGITSAIVGFNFGKWIGQKFAEWFNPEDVKYYTEFSWTGENGFFKALADEISIEIDNMKTNVSAGLSFIQEKVNALPTSSVAGFNGFKVNLEDVGNAISTWYNDKVVPFFQESKWSALLANVGLAFEGHKSALDLILGDIENNSIKAFVDNVKKYFSKDYWTQTSTLAWLGTDLANLAVNIDTTVQNIKNTFISLKNTIVSIARTIASAIASIASGGNRLTQYYHSPSFRTTPIRMHANGGFVEDGLFMANHNELIGQFSNGKTAVANNEQIVSGIQNGVYGAMSESNALLMEQNALLQAILEKETGINANDIFRSVQRSASNYSKQYGRPAFN